MLQKAAELGNAFAYLKLGYIYLEGKDVKKNYKKAIYLYMREITGLNTKQIVSCLNKMRAKYRLFKKKWDEGEIN